MKRQITRRPQAEADLIDQFTYYLTTDPEFWLDLQSQHDLDHADRQNGKAIRALKTRASHEAPAAVEGRGEGNEESRGS